MKRLKTVALGVLFLSLFMLAAIIAVVEVLFVNISQELKIPNKIWRHRGGTPENKISSVIRTMKSGQQGVEVDLHFDGQSKFILSHDTPKEPRGETLRDLLSATQGFVTRYFWLDLKNLTKSNSEVIGELLVQLFQEFAVMGRIYVESSEASGLAQLRRRGIKTIFWIRPKQDLFWLRNLKYKLYILIGEHSAVSMDHELYTASVESIYQHLPVFLFTVNDPEKMSRLMIKPNVKVILTDADKIFLSRD